MPTNSRPPVVVLHRPQIGENIGMSARAMANCGLTELRLSDARKGWDVDKAIATSAGGQEIVAHRQDFPDLPEAIKDMSHIYATTARRRNMPVRVIAPEVAAREIRALPNDQQACLLFGAEATGLTNDEVALTSAVIEIPLNPACTSLNLSQAVLLCAYAWWVLDAPKLPETLPAPAHTQEVEFFLERLYAALDHKGFFTDPELAVVMRRNIRTVMHRSQLRPQELQTWHGILSALIRE